jgi:hypothetical protein
MSTPAQRIDSLINALNLNINSFSKECGYHSSATIWRLINEGAKPSTPTLNKICNRFPQVDREWLMTGYGNMFLATASNEDEITVTAKQTLKGISEIIKNKDVFAKELFVRLEKKIDELSARIFGVEVVLGLDVKKKQKKKNGI